MPATANITIYRAEDITLNYTMNPLEDVSGWTIVFTLRHSRTSAVLASITASIIDGPNGIFQILVPSVTTNITAQKYLYDVVRTDPGADKELAIGEFVIKSGVRTP